jgi:aerobic-type carbon monoxide dehydrogenase small subunit (CoxS/CutS family)
VIPGTDGARHPKTVHPKTALALRVNGVDRDMSVDAGTTLLSVLRDDLGLTGTKLGCGRGECGACTVLVAGVPVLACITLASRVSGEVTTIEALLARDPDLQQAFADHGGFQCGFCTPGQLMSAAALLAAEPDPSPQRIRHVMSGNICRCTGYAGIVAAVEDTARRRNSRLEPAEGRTR